MFFFHFAALSNWMQPQRILQVLCLYSIVFYNSSFFFKILCLLSHTFKFAYLAIIHLKYESIIFLRWEIFFKSFFYIVVFTFFKIKINNCFNLTVVDYRLDTMSKQYIFGSMIYTVSSNYTFIFTKTDISAFIEEIVSI